MFYRKNLPAWERGARLLVGLLVAASPWAGLHAMPAWALLGAGLGLAASGLIGFCPACAMVGRRPLG